MHYEFFIWGELNVSFVYNTRKEGVFLVCVFCFVSLSIFCIMVLYLPSICVRIESIIEFCIRFHIVPHSFEACRWASYSSLFMCSFLWYRNLISSFMRIVDVLRWVMTEAGEVYGTRIFAYVGMTFRARHCLLK